MTTLNQNLTQGDRLDRDAIRMNRFPLAFTPRISIGDPVARLTESETATLQSILNSGNQFGFQLPRGISQFFGR